MVKHGKGMLASGWKWHEAPPTVPTPEAGYGDRVLDNGLSKILINNNLPIDGRVSPESN